MFSVVPQERHRFGSFPFETGTGIAFPHSFIIVSIPEKRIDLITNDGRNKMPDVVGEMKFPVYKKGFEGLIEKGFCGGGGAMGMPRPTPFPQFVPRLIKP
jgi:hypothetical protein